MNRFFLFSGLLLFVLLSDINSAFAQTPVSRLWTGGAGTTNWNTPNNWSPSGVPATIDQVTISTNVTLTNGVPISPTVGSLFINGATVQLGNNIGSITVAGISISTPTYTFKMSSGASLGPANTSFLLTITGAAPIVINSSTLGTNGNVSINSSRTSGDDISDQTVIVDNTTFNGSFTCTANCYKFTSTTFNGVANITKTSSVYSVNNGSNSFNSTTTLINNGVGILSWGNGDAFNSATAQVSLYNNSSGTFLIASSGVTSPNRTAANFYGPVNAINTSTGSLILSNSSTNAVNFNGISTPVKNIFFNNTSSGQIQIGNAGAVTFKYSNVYIGSTGSGITYIGFTPASTPGGAPRVSVEGTSNFNTAIGGASTPLFTSGELHIDRFDLLSSTTYPACSLSCNTSAAFNFKMGVRANRNFIVNAYRIIGIGGNYNNTTSFTLSSGASPQQTNTYSVAASAGTTGDNLTFNNNVSFINAAGSTWTIGGSNVSPTSTTSNHAINFNPPSTSSRSSLLIQTNDIGDIHFGYLDCTINITNSDFKVRRNIARASIYFGLSANINVISTDPTLANVNNRTDLKIEQSGDVSTYNYSIVFGVNASRTFTFNGVMNTTSLLGGNLVFGKFTGVSDVNIAAGTSPHTETLITISGNAIFNKNSSFAAPNITATGGTFGSVPTVAPKVMPPTNIPTYLPSDYTYTSSFNRTSGAATGIPNYFTGSPVFNGAVSIYNSSVSDFVFGSISTDVFTFNGDVSVYRGGTGNVRTSGAGLSYYNGHYTYSGTPSDMAGKSVFKGLIDQKITCSLPVIRFNILEVKKTAPISPALLNDVVLMYPASVGGTASSQLILTYGNIRTTATNILTLDDGTTVTPTTEVSFVDGPLKKTGLIPGTADFIFQIGKSVISGSTVNKIFMPVAITIPASTSSTYTAEFFNDIEPMGNLMASTTGIRDLNRCQYWTISHTGVNENIAVTLPWDNASGKTCYPVNPNVVCVAQYSIGQWQNVGSNVTVGVNQGVVKSNVLTSQLTGPYVYFAIGYRNALVINTINANPTLYKVLNHTESLPDKFVSGSLGTAAGNRTVVSDVNNVPGKVVIHPDFSSTLDVKIDQSYKDPLIASLDPKADAVNYQLLNLKLYTNAQGSVNVIDHVTIDEDGDNTFLTLLPDVYKISGNSLSFYKEKQSPTTFDLTNNLSDAVTYTVNRYLTTPYAPFQITSTVPIGYSATLNIYDINNVLVATNNMDLSWNAKPTSTTFSPEGLYRYEVVLTNGTTTKTYKGQLILKHQ